jgi:UDP-2,3-diacylglucosamine hydrolase
MHRAAVPPSALTAPKHWTAIDFISDLHLQASEPRTFEVWKNYMGTTPADAVFILGDLFEVWVGDDVLTATNNWAEPEPSFEMQCAQVLRQSADRLAVFFMHGNRDFLFLDAAASACGLKRLNDPCTLTFGQQNFLLSHGDALCLDDKPYMAFRAEVRSAAWQQAFLAKPLPERNQIARALRTQSEARKRLEPANAYADVDSHEAVTWLTQADAQTLIHGHTHKPADHDLGEIRQRQVLSDWDATATPPRAQVLRLSLGASLGMVSTQRLAVDARGLEVAASCATKP